MLLLLTIVSGLLLVVLTSVGATVFNIEMVIPNAPIIAIVFASTQRDPFPGVVTALVVGAFAAALVGGDRGELMLSFLVVAVITRGLHVNIPIGAYWTQLSWVVASCLVADVTFAVLRGMFEQDAAHFAVLWRLSPAVALATGALAVPVLAVLRAIEPTVRQRDEHHALVL